MERHLSKERARIALDEAKGTMSSVGGRRRQPPRIIAAVALAAALTGAGMSHACGGQTLTSPTAPFSGSFTFATTSTVNCPPTCPPTTLRLAGTAQGTATHLGRFTAESLDVVNTATSSSTGTLDFTAANGDRLFTTTVGREDRFIPPNVSHVSSVVTIVGGTGRFAAATGTLTARQIGTIDFAAGTSSGTGSFEGSVSLSN